MLQHKSINSLNVSENGVKPMEIEENGNDKDPLIVEKKL